MVWQKLSDHPATVPLGMAIIVVLQLLILIQGSLDSSASRGADPTTGSQQPVLADKTGDDSGNSVALLTAAKAAFTANDSDKAVAMLSALLAREPANPSALDLYRDQLHQQLESALSERDWELAQIQIAAYDGVLPES